MKEIEKMKVGKEEGEIWENKNWIRINKIKIEMEIRRKVDIVDEKKIWKSDKGEEIEGNLIKMEERDEIEGKVGKVGREGRGKIVKEGLDEKKIEVRKKEGNLKKGMKIDRRIIKNGSVREKKSLKKDDKVLRKGLKERKNKRVLMSINIVGDEGERIFIENRIEKILGKCGIEGEERKKDEEEER